MIEKYQKIIVNQTSLEDNYPFGLFDEFFSDSSRNAVEVIRLLESLIFENSRQNLFTLRSMLLQANSYRNFEDEKQYYDIEVNTVGDGFINNLIASLTPEHYKTLTEDFTLVESEIFLKNYLSAHQFWGKPEGVVTLIKSMIENVLGKDIKIKHYFNKSNTKEISQNLQSRLNRQNSKLGVNLIAGSTYESSPNTIDIKIGPISYSDLEMLQMNNFADDIHPSRKLNMLASVCEPYFLNTKIEFLLATDGFVINKSILGKEKLGVVYKLSE